MFKNWSRSNIREILYFWLNLKVSRKKIVIFRMAHCVWKVPLGSGNHVVEFLHGTTTGSRQIKVDGIELYKVDWMFRLVGEEKVTKITFSRKWSLIAQIWFQHCNLDGSYNARKFMKFFSDFFKRQFPVQYWPEKSPLSDSNRSFGWIYLHLQVVCCWERTRGTKFQFFF